jgi:pSer/pThr/pTyr-binding forkhead associated (FHA) protein
VVGEGDFTPTEPSDQPHSAAQARAAAARRGFPVLLYRDAAGREQIYVLDPTRSPVAIGRSRSAAISIPWDEKVSRRHAQLELVGEDWTIDWTLVDDGRSRNGSYVNGERVVVRARLRDRDVLTIGDTAILFRASIEAPADALARSADRPAPDDDPSPSGMTQMGRPLVTRRSLSDSQYNVLVALARPWLASGVVEAAADEEIARALFLSVETVRAHLDVLYARFHVEGFPPSEKRVRVVKLAAVGGLLPIPPR